MAAFNNGFPVTYQQMYPTFNPYQTAPQPVPQQTQTKMVEVIPVDNPDAAASYPTPVGSTLMLFARDDSFIAIKSSGVNGQSSFDVYDKRPPAPPSPSFDPSVFVRKDEIDEMIAAAVAAQMSPKRQPRKEGE